jgi:hypothetical protein
MLDTSFIEKRMFKEIAGGYIFQPPPPSIFTPTNAVLANEPQRAEILAIMRKGSATWRRVSTRFALGIAVATGIAVGHIDDMPMLASVFIGVCVGFITLVFATQLALWHKLVALRPLLARLPRSPDLLFPKEPVRMWTEFDWSGRRGSR